MVGNIVIARFPYTDLSDVGVRPGLLVGDVRNGRYADWIVCPVTRGCRQIISSFRRKPESRRFHTQIVLQRQVILDSRESGNDGSGPH